MHRCEILVPITLSKYVLDIAFKNKIFVSLHCFECKRSHRTVVLFEDQGKSLCTLIKHNFPGRIVDLSVSKRGKPNIFSSKSVITAKYIIEYEFEPFEDKKYPHRKITPKLTWSRAAFKITCECGERKEMETQNNLVRPLKGICRCGKYLYYEQDEIPFLQN